MRLNKNNLDVSRIFVVFVTLIGDVERTAAALDLDPEVVRKLADEENWHSKIARVSLLSKSDKPGEYAKATNRALNFASAHRLRLVLDKVIQEFDGLTPEEVVDKLSQRTASGAISVSSRFLADLASALERVSHLSYVALGDSVGERADQTEDDQTFTANEMHSAVIAALSNPAIRNIPEKLLKEEQAQISNHKYPTNDTIDERNPPAEASGNA